MGCFFTSLFTIGERKPSSRGPRAKKSACGACPLRSAVRTLRKQIVCELVRIANNQPRRQLGRGRVQVPCSGLLDKLVVGLMDGYAQRIIVSIEEFLSWVCFPFAPIGYGSAHPKKLISRRIGVGTTDAVGERDTCNLPGDHRLAPLFGTRGTSHEQQSTRLLASSVNCIPHPFK